MTTFTLIGRLGCCLSFLPLLHAQTTPTWEVPASLRDWQVGGVLFPNLHMHGIVGTSSGDLETLAPGAHDPRGTGLSAQALEPGVSLRTRYIEGFANYLFYQDADGRWDGEQEEGFLKWMQLPGGLEPKLGRFFSRYGALNQQHLHAWDFVDTETVNTRFLGNHGLLLEGAECSWTLPLGMDPVLTSVFSLGYGHVPAHGHQHEHAHGADEPRHEPEGAVPNDDVTTLRWMARYRFDDFHAITLGTSFAQGGNSLHRDARIHSIDAEYLWRENGLEPGGDAFRWRNEFLWREFGAYSEHDDDDDGVIDETYDETLRETGCYSHAIYSWGPHYDAGLRLGWVAGNAGVGLAEILRVSPMFTWWLDGARTVGLRTQYNYDAQRHGREDHSFWCQLNLSLGETNEVR